MKGRVSSDDALIVTLISFLVLMACMLVAIFAPAAGLGVGALLVVFLCYLWSQVER